jgi:hypothetical protein
MATMMTRRNVAAQAKKSGTSFNKPKVRRSSGPQLHACCSDGPAPQGSGFARV